MFSEEKLIERGQELGLTVLFTAAGGAYVKTPMGNWRIIPSGTKWIIRHQNLSFKRGARIGDYHRQKGIYPTFENAMLYISVHDHTKTCERARKRICA